MADTSICATLIGHEALNEQECKKMDVNSSMATLEHRLAAVERELVELRSLLTITSPPADWLQKVTGSVTDEEAFREVLELGRAIRSADRPSEEGDNRQ